MTAMTEVDPTTQANAAALDAALARVRSRSSELSTEAAQCAARLGELAESLNGALPPSPGLRAAGVAAAMRRVQVLEAELELACLEVQAVLLRQ